MNCIAETIKNHETQIFTEGFRILFGITLMLVGLYIGAFTDFQGHGLGFLLIFGSPFILLSDEK